jgi:hypothetical protein
MADQTDMHIRTSDQPRDVREALAAARQARSPADVVKHLFLAIAYQQQQIENLELALGLQDAKATEGIRERARRVKFERTDGQIDVGPGFTL